MGRHQSDDQRDQSFPDEFGHDLLNEQIDRPAGPPLAQPPFWGYLTRNWFGPFLLSPPGRREKGHC